MSYVNEFSSNFGGNGAYPVDEEEDRSVEAGFPENPNSDIKRDLRRLMHVAVKNEQNDLLDILNRTYAEIVDLEEEEEMRNLRNRIPSIFSLPFAIHPDNM